MKTRILLTALLLALTATLARAQHEDHYGDVRVGPVATGGSSINAGDVANGTKTSPLFNYSAGALADVPMSDNMALDLTLAYDTRAVNFHMQGNTDIGVDFSYGYLAVRPTVRVNAFYLGLGMGFPVSASTTGHGQSAPTVKTSDVNVLYEARLGGRMQLVDTKPGTLYLTLDGAYAFNRILAHEYFKDEAPDNKNNGPLATAQLGVLFLFDVMKHNESLEVAKN